MSSVKPLIFEADEFGHAIVACPECKFKRRVNVNKYRGLDKIFSIKCICQANVVCRFTFPERAPRPEGAEAESAGGGEPPLLNVRNDGLVRIKCPGCESETLSNVTRFKERREVFSVRCACGTEHSFRVRYPDEAARPAREQEAPSRPAAKAADKKGEQQSPDMAAPLVFKPQPGGGCQIQCPNCSAKKLLPQSMIKDPQKIFAVSCKCGLNFSFRISDKPQGPPPQIQSNLDELISVTSSGEDLLRAIEGGDPLLLRETFRPEPVADDTRDFESDMLRQMLGQDSGEEAPDEKAPEEDVPEVDLDEDGREEDIPEVDIDGDDDDIPEVDLDEDDEDEEEVVATETAAGQQASAAEATGPREYEQDEPIIFFPNSKGITRIICPECHFEKQVNAESFRRVRGPVGIQCKCGLQFQCRIEFRQAYRKMTMLAGEYIKQRDNEPGRFVIRDLSLGGAGIRILGPHTIHPGDVLFVRFTLDNALGTEIRKTLKVIHIDGQDIGGTFTEKNYAQDLGYYLMA